MPCDKQEGLCFKDNNDYNFPSKQVTSFATSKYTSIMISFNNRAAKVAIQQWITINVKGSTRLKEVSYLFGIEARLLGSATLQKHV